MRQVNCNQDVPTICHAKSGHRHLGTERTGKKRGHVLYMSAGVVNKASQPLVVAKKAPLRSENHRII